MRKILFVLLLLFVTGASIADNSMYDIFGDGHLIDKDFKEKKHKALKVEIPSFPEKSNLVPMKMYHASRKFFIDIKSISIDKKGYEARYTVLIESSSGVANVIYEGLRCNTREYRIYAYGNSDSKSFSVKASSDWRTVANTSRGPFRYRKDLLDYYMCKKGVIRFKIKDIVRTLKHPPALHSADDYH